MPIEYAMCNQPRIPNKRWTKLNFSWHPALFVLYWSHASMAIGQLSRLTNSQRSVTLTNRDQRRVSLEVLVYSCLSDASNIFYSTREFGYPNKIPPEKNHFNAVEREPIPTRVLNPNASEASYKPKQRSYRKTKLKKSIYYFFFFGGILVGGILSGNCRCTPLPVTHFQVSFFCGKN